MLHCKGELYQFSGKQDHLVQTDIDTEIDRQTNRQIDTITYIQTNKQNRHTKQTD